jgi:hypothetical protein
MESSRDHSADTPANLTPCQGQPLAATLARGQKWGGPFAGILDNASGAARHHEDTAYPSSCRGSGASNSCVRDGRPQSRNRTCGFGSRQPDRRRGKPLKKGIRDPRSRNLSSQEAGMRPSVRTATRREGFPFRHCARKAVRTARSADLVCRACDVADRVRLRSRSANVDAEVTQVEATAPAELGEPEQKKHDANDGPEWHLRIPTDPLCGGHAFVLMTKTGALS